jgi:cytochrome c biogenesis protein CcdA
MVSELTIGYITALAGADAVNPCALAVLALVLVAILTFNPKDRKRVLLAGLTFSITVYFVYLLYGLVIIQAFKAFANSVEGIKIYLHMGLGILAIILGALNIKDAIWYKAGQFMTEMPMWLRPKVKKLISKITSPWGAFIIGIVVTLFLLPCTIGPYLIASGLLSYVDFLNAIPWLLYYNLIFILPMVAITIIIYIGFTTVHNVSGWKDKNIRYLHFIAGLLLVGLGIAMLFGWV